MTALRDRLVLGDKIVLTANDNFASFKCIHCHKIFISDYSLRKHIQKRHFPPMSYKMPSFDIENYPSNNYLTQVHKKSNLPVLSKENHPHYPLYDTSNIHYLTKTSKQKKSKIPKKDTQDALVYCVKMDENWSQIKTKSDSCMQTLINNTNENTTQTDLSRKSSVKVGTNEIKKNMHTQTYTRLDTVGTTMFNNVKLENIKITHEKGCGTEYSQNNTSTQTFVQVISVGVGSEKILLKNKTTSANLEEKIKKTTKNVSTSCENIQEKMYKTVGTSMENILKQDKDLASSYIESCSNTLKTDIPSDVSFEKEPIIIHDAMEPVKSINYFELLNIKPKTSSNLSINSIRDVLEKRQCSTRNWNMVLNEFQVLYFFEVKMREIGVNPEWDKLPTNELRNCLDLLRLKRDSLNEMDPEFYSNKAKLRQEINNLLEQKIQNQSSAQTELSGTN